MTAWPDSAGAGFREPARIELYLLAVFTLAALLLSGSILAREMTVPRAVASAAVPALVFGFLAVAARYPVRALPLRGTRWPLVAGTHLAAGAGAGLVWMMAQRSWLRIFGELRGAPAEAMPPLTLWAGAGFLLYFVAVATHYLIAALEASAAARQVALRYELSAREAELKAFKAQIDPHFLFNSLNAIASLCGSRPLEARTMAQRLADFFRLTLRAGKHERISLGEELDLVRRYLDVERVRFGERLETRLEVDPAASSCAVPPLILQPLVENAVRHGIAGLVDGGTIAIEASVNGARLSVSISNPRDPDARVADGEGIGLANVRGRLHGMHGDEASVRVERGEASFSVVLTLPCRPLERKES